MNRNQLIKKQLQAEKEGNIESWKKYTRLLMEKETCNK